MAAKKPIPRQLEHHEYDHERLQFPIEVLCDNSSSPQNIGMIFRLADAFGVKHLLLTGISPVPPNRKIRKTSRSTERFIPFSYHKDPLALLTQKKAEGATLIGLELTNHSKPLDQVDFPELGPLVLVLGSEQNGISEACLALLDHSVHINQYGSNSSINVATALAVALYEISQQFTK